MKYRKKNRHKFILKCHLIFVCKYRKPLINEAVRKEMLFLFRKIEETSSFRIEIMEADRNHMHMLIDYPPTLSITSIVRRLKQISTKELWKLFGEQLRKEFWKERTFWNDGYFVCSIGEANPETIRKYIENQG